jgi:hypothetical protein
MRPGRVVVGCLGFVLFWAALGAGADRVMAPVVPAEARFWLAAASGFLLALGLQSFWYLARGVGRGAGSRGELLRRAATGEVPAEGGAIVATGFARSLGPPLLAPLSGTECVGYFYRMYYEGHATSEAGRRTEVPVYWGHRARPFVIDSASARLRVLAVPLLVDAPTRRSGDAALARARQWIASTRFEDVKGGLLGATRSALEVAHTVFTDEDGEERRDFRAAGDRRDPATLILEETLLPEKQVVSVAGRWSAERRAIVAGGEGSVGSTVSAVLGPPQNLRRDPSALPHSFAAYLATATLLTGLGAGIVWFAIRILPGLH